MVVLCGSWAKSATRLGGAASLALGFMLGCGGRTSMVEVDGFVAPSDDDGGGAKGGGSSKGGSSSKGGGTSRGGTGAAGTPAGVAGRPSTSPSSPTTAPCTQYCRGYSVTCTEKLEDDNCQALCEGELNAANGDCQKLGIEAVTCLAPYFRPGSGSCKDASDRGLGQCGATLDKFKTCSGGTAMPTPDRAEPASCATTGVVSPEGCQLNFGCPSGLYEINCDALPNTGGVMHCFCYRDTHGTMFDVGRVTSSSACYDAFAYCP